MNERLISRRCFASTIGCFGIASIAVAGAVEPPITALAFSPEGEFLVSGSQAGLWVRQAETTRALRSIETSLPQIHDATFSSDGKTLAIAGGTPGESGVVELLDWPSGRQRQRIQCHDDVVYGVAFTADNRHLLNASADGVCTCVAVGQSTAVTRMTKHSRAVMSVVVLPDGKTAVSGSRDETLRVWDTSTGENLRTLHNHVRAVNDLALRPGPAALPMVASASADRTVRFWQPTIGRMVRFGRLPSEPLSLAWIGGGTSVAAACRDGTVCVIDPDTATLVETIAVAPGWLYSIAVDPRHDDRVALGGSDGMLCVKPLGRT